MLNRNVQNPARPVGQLANTFDPKALGCSDRPPLVGPSGSPSRWLRTGSAARAWGVTTRWVRQLAREHRVPCERTREGQWLFLERDVERVATERMRARLATRQELLAMVRPRMIRATAPRQSRLRLARCG